MLKNGADLHFENDLAYRGKHLGFILELTVHPGAIKIESPFILKRSTRFDRQDRECLFQKLDYVRLLTERIDHDRKRYAVIEAVEIRITTGFQLVPNRVHCFCSTYEQELASSTKIVKNGSSSLLHKLQDAPAFCVRLLQRLHPSAP